MNLFTSENLQKYKLSNSSGHGEWMVYKGENAIGLAPTCFYSNSTYVKVLENELVVVDAIDFKEIKTNKLKLRK